MYNEQTYQRILQNLQSLYEIGYMSAQNADNILMQVCNGYGSVQSIMNTCCADYGFWLNNGLIPQKATTFDNYGCPHSLSLSKSEVKDTIINYVTQKMGLPVGEVKTLSMPMQRHACKYKGILALEPCYIVINLCTSYRCVMFYYCQYCQTLYVLDDTLTPIGVTLPYETIFRKQINIQAISRDYTNMELKANQRMLFSRNPQVFINGDYIFQSVQPSLYNMQVQGMITQAQYNDIQKLIVCGNSVKKVFDTYFSNYVDTVNKGMLPFRRTRFDNEGNAIPVHYTKAEKLIGYANMIQANLQKPVETVMRIGEPIQRHVCKYKGIIRLKPYNPTIFNGQEMLKGNVYYCEYCHKLLYLDGDEMPDSINEENMIEPTAI